MNPPTKRKRERFAKNRKKFQKKDKKKKFYEK